jgi:hypothetical protein
MHGIVSHFADPKFWRRYDALPGSVRQLADKALLLLKQTPAAPSLRLKKAGRYWSIRIGRHHRALAVEIPEGLLWFWIGDHAEYDRLIARRK